MLRTAGLKCTPPRLAVLTLLAEGGHYINAQEIHEKLGKKKGLDLVTIYRTLASFEKAGIAKRVDVRKGAVYYEFNEGHHHHVICTNCEKVAEFTDAGDEELIAKALKQVKGFSSISHHSFDLFGLCNTCAKK
jgi:Fur family ferric uptake transcriptional regulator